MMNQAIRLMGVKRCPVSGGGVSCLRRLNLNTANYSDRSGEPEKKDEAEPPKGNKGSSNMPGGAYATRSDEAGVGSGEWGGKAEENVKFDRKFNQDHPAYNKSQRSDQAEEKEKAGGHDRGG